MRGSVNNMKFEYLQNYICNIYEESTILEVVTDYDSVYSYFMLNRQDRFLSRNGLKVKVKSTGMTLFTIHTQFLAGKNKVNYVGTPFNSYKQLDLSNKHAVEFMILSVIEALQLINEDDIVDELQKYLD